MICNRDIRTGIKSKRLKWAEEADQLSWAYMKEIRENNRTQKIFAIDPYVEVYRFRDNVYGLFTENADGMGDVWMFLIVGTQKAMLIDTGFGIGDLKGLCDEITGGIPLVVVNTHPHPDHSYGNCRFEKVYCHEYSVPQLKLQNPQIWDYLFDENGKCIWLEFDRTDLPAFHEYQIIGCPDGQIFDLGGGCEIELVHTAGHHPGHAAFLDKKNRILFAGDDVCSMRISVGGPRPGQPYSEYATIRALYSGLQKLALRLEEIDEIYPSHYICGLESSIIQNILETCDTIIEDPESYDYHDVFEGKERLQKSVKGLGTIGYNRNSIG